LMGQEAAELPGVSQMLKEGLALELSQHIGGIDAGIDQIAENKINNSILPPKGHCRFCSFFCQGIKACPFASGKHHSQYSTIHDFLLSQACLSLMAPTLRPS